VARTRKAILVDSRALSPSVRGLRFVTSDGAPVGHIAGQYLDLVVATPGGLPFRRSYSIASAPDVEHPEAFELAVTSRRARLRVRVERDGRRRHRSARTGRVRSARRAALRDLRLTAVASPRVSRDAGFRWAACGRSFEYAAEVGDTRDVEGRDRERPGKGVGEASAESSFAAGAVVAGKLRIIRTVGAGGMGKVYEVEHELTRHRRALKVLHPSASPNVVERFVREATAAARIGNPHVAETFDAGTLETGEPYLLMELLEGETLEERLRRAGPIPSGELAALIQQACVGIQAAHDAGIVHRDLKPENLFVTSREGQPFVKILDFGISKFDEGRTGAPGITRDGVMLGTPYYMSPEQVLGAATDARTDVYALGVILYESACGHRPFEAPVVSLYGAANHETQIAASGCTP